MKTHYLILVPRILPEPGFNLLDTANGGSDQVSLSASPAEKLEEKCAVHQSECAGRCGLHV